MSAVRERLKLFCWARGQHQLRMAGKRVTFTAVARLVAKRAGVDMAAASAVLAGKGACKALDEAALQKLAAWNGLAFRDGALVADYASQGEAG